VKREVVDTVVVGSGPGGSTLARELARAGRRVLVLERGQDYRDKPYYGTYLGALRYAEHGSFLFTRQGMNVIRPLMVGGATSMYCGSAAMPPDWLKECYGIDVQHEAEDAARELKIAPLPVELRGEASTRLAEAACDQGMEWQPQPKFMDPSRCPNGFDCGAKCMLGCRCGAKWNAGEYLDEAVALGAVLWTGAQARRVLIEDGVVVGVAGQRKGQPFEVHAGTVVLAAGGLGSPQLLRSAGVEGIGSGLAMDSTLMVYGIASGKGIGHEPPMTWGWSDHEHGFMLSTLVDPWLMYPLIMVHKGLRSVLSWPRWGRTLGIMVKIKDEIAGELSADGSIHKPLVPADRERLERGIESARRILVAAGCKPESLVITPLRGTHPSATVRIGHGVDSQLQTPLRGLYVCDASVFPEALDAPTVLTIIALARRLASHLLGAASKSPKPAPMDVGASGDHQS
jgi:choline dehydrogenase-like flavoprotein